MSFADNLRAVLEGKGISQSGLARLLGVKSQAVNQWVKPGGTAPRGTRLHDIAKALGVSLQELLGSPAPTNKRARLLAAFDAMDEERREALLTTAELLARLPHMEAPQAASIGLKRTPTPPPHGARKKRKSC